MKVLIEHKETEVVQLENYFKQIAVSFKIYADFECNVKGAKGNNKIIILHILKIINHMFLALLLTKLYMY